jgi:hypothetical protein
MVEAVLSGSPCLTLPRLLLTLRCVLRSNSTGIVQGVVPVPDTILRNMSVLSLVVIWGIMA